jgi:hypothetical protein
LAATVEQLRAIALRSLVRMYRPEQQLFAFRIRRVSGEMVLEGVSRRYTAIALMGLAGEAEDTAKGILAGQNPMDLCGRLLREIDGYQDIGEVALTLWAAQALRHPDAAKAVRRLGQMNPADASCPTVELSWALTSLVCGSIGDADLAGKIARRLLSSFHRESALFPHWPAGAKSPLFRRHVTCFADFIYPIQALSYYHMVSGDQEAIDVATRCADRMCELQGPQGQWWWHFDVRTGRVVEKYPVYAVHQEAMAPMAMSILDTATGMDHASAVGKGIGWLKHSPEISASLIDTEADLVWRKVARHEPGKLVRGLQAAASRLHSSLRVPGTDLVFRPGWIDYESRPYCMGWILHAWAR